MKEVLVNEEPVELYKLIKFVGMAASGGEAKAMIAEGQVLVNGLVETRKRRKLMSGDTVELGGIRVQVRLA